MKKIRKKPQKPMFFLRILNLIRNRRHKKVRRVLMKETIKTFILVHKGLWWCMGYIFPIILIATVIMAVLIIAYFLGYKFDKSTVIICSIALLLLFYEIIRKTIQH